jgi:hypothetical protein
VSKWIAIAPLVLTAAACGSSPTSDSSLDADGPDPNIGGVAASVPSFTQSGSTVLTIATGTFSNGTTQNVTASCSQLAGR